MNVLLFDVETTGLDPKKSYIISIGAILFKKNNETGESEIKEFTRFLNWNNFIKNFEVPEDTIKIHHITNEFLKTNGIDPFLAFKELRDFIVENIGSLDHLYDNLYLNMAFNLPYDLNMFHSNLKKLLNLPIDESGNDSCLYRQEISELLDILTKIEDNKNKLFIDPLIIDRLLHFEVDGVKVKHNLDAVGKRYGIPEDENAHDALADTRRMLKIWEKQILELNDLEIALDEKFEGRLKRAYERQEAKYKSRNRLSLDYFAKNAVETI